MKLAGRTILITGASSGIGEAIAYRFAREGAAIAVLASSDQKKAEGVAARIRTLGGRAWSGVADVRQRAQIDSALQSAEVALGPIDTVVNAAGVYYATPVGSTSVEDMDRMIDINLKGTFNVINAIAPRLIAAGRGNIINLSSVAAVLGVRECSLYCGTKAAIAQMTVALARELAPNGISVNAIAPGNTATPMNAAIRTDPQFAPQLAGMKAATPSPTTFSDPDDIASVALFLASGEAKALHGALIVADEGLSTGLG